MAILLNNNCEAGNSAWEKALAKYIPDMPVFSYPELPDTDAVQYALVWNHPKGDLQNYPNLRCILSLAAGMEHLTCDPDLPDVPLVSLGDPAMSQEMANYALYWVINAQRQFDQYRIQQGDRHWQRHDIRAAGDFNVLVLGLGRIGVNVARTIQAAGFNVDAWDFKDKPKDNLNTHYAVDALDELLPSADVVVSCLALSNNSQQFVNERFLSKMSPQGHFINISRGDIADEEALLNALNQQQINGAVLDVAHIEPLPADHPFWNHPKVVITPHMAGPTYVDSAARIIVDNINRIEKGLLPEPVFDRNRGLQHEISNTR